MRGGRKKKEALTQLDAELVHQPPHPGQHAALCPGGHERVDADGQACGVYERVQTARVAEDGGLGCGCDFPESVLVKSADKISMRIRAACNAP